MKTFKVLFDSPPEEPLVARVSRIDGGRKYISFYFKGRFGIPSKLKLFIGNTHGPIVTQDASIADNLQPGDIVVFNPDGKAYVAWTARSYHNVFFITGACNCNCIMCPQPPLNFGGIDHRKLNMKILSLLSADNITQVCFTGGEPTLNTESMIALASGIKKMKANMPLDVLTNGINMADFDLVKTLVTHLPSSTTYCIPIHADVASIHESINRMPGSFYKTINGIYHLSRFRQRIEIRFVISKLNYGRMASLADYISRNLPFVSHVAFMGQEICGNAEKNYDEVWVDPFVYKNMLADVAEGLHRRGINVSIYNTPLCLLPERAWRFSRKSISDWKNTYLNNCNTCIKQNECCGVFSTSGEHQSVNIRAIHAPLIN